MAESLSTGEDEVIIIEEGENLFDEPELPELDTSPKDSKQELSPLKKILNEHRSSILFGSGLLLITIIFSALFGLFSNQDEPPAPPKKPTLDRKDLKKAIQKSDIEKMLAKANLMYESGNKQKALDLFHHISLYNESLSQYNLGVLRYKEGDYEGALKAFEEALKNQENRCASAINAAISARMLGRDESFKYYIHLAEASLENETTSPLYSYYHTLINYYLNHPIKALASINHKTSEHFTPEQNHIGAELHLMLDDPLGSLTFLEQNQRVTDSFALGLLYANIGDYPLSIRYLQDALDHNISPDHAREALALSHLQNNAFKDASKVVKSAPKGYELGRYPIKTILKPRLFDIDLAQEYHAQKLLTDKELAYAMIFYFSPYQVIDAKQTIITLRKGELGLSRGEMELAQSYLKSSTKRASTNAQISLAIKLALNNHTVKANKLLRTLQKQFPRQGVLEYNLALSYAQLGDYYRAHEHFKRANFLQPENFLAGIYALFTAELSGYETKPILERLEKELRESDNQRNRDFFETLRALQNDDFRTMVEWLDTEKAKNPIYLMIDIMIADRLDKNPIARSRANHLLQKYPDDIIANILYLYAFNKELPVKKYAFNAQHFMRSVEVDYDPLFYGPKIVRDLYLRTALFTGNLPKIKLMLTERLGKELHDIEGILQALGMTNIYLKEFEEAFVQYNQLIDELHVSDTFTLLYAAIAAIGGNHQENAAILLEIAKRTDRRNFEARYGLGLLYHELKNYEGAMIQYGLIDDGYESQFFDFELKR